MKATTATQRKDLANVPLFPYPNAATRRQIQQKVLDFMVMVASGLGVGAMLLFLLANG